MKMNLKNRNKKTINNLKLKLTSKNLFIFLISLSVVTVILGIIFYLLLSSNDKETVNNSLESYFTLKNDYDYLRLLKEKLLNNTYNIFLIWVLGISVIGIPLVIFIYFAELFSVGFTLASIFSVYKIKGLFASFCYLFPSKVCYLIVIFFLTFFAIKISYKLIKQCFLKEEISIKKEINRYLRILIIAFLAIIGISMLTVFIEPLFIKFFTTLI